MLHRSSLCAMAALLRDRVISPLELVEAHLRQIEAVNPKINAFVTVLADQALAEAREKQSTEPVGMLHGLPVTVKDSFDVAGHSTRTGSSFRADIPASQDSAAVARLRAEGAIILGKTNTPEMLSAYETDNHLTGRTNNPWDLDRTPGGSSGGEAAAISACCSPGGVSTDGGGSIRLPAHFCGIAGLKPTPGRIPTVGHFPALGHPAGLVTVAGPMARSVEDLHLLFSALCAYDARDPFSVPVPIRPPKPARSRIGVWEQFYTVPVAPEIREAVQHAVTLLAGAGFTTETFEPQGMNRVPNVWAFLFSDWPGSITRKLLEGRESEAHWTLLQSVSGKTVTGEQVLTHLAARDRMRAALLAEMENVPVLLMPAVGIPAFRHRERRWQIDGTEIGLFQALMPSLLANVLGLPAVTLPILVSPAGLPVGIQLVGRPFEDETILDIAIRLEKSRGPFPYPPLVS